jgi:hypothetical protein
LTTSLRKYSSIVVATISLKLDMDISSHVFETISAPCARGGYLVEDGGNGEPACGAIHMVVPQAVSR